MKEFTLPSGATLRVTLAPFADADALLKALLSEAKTVGFNGGTDAFQVCKEILCAGFSSPLIDRALKKCMEKCLYDNQKINADTFEKEESRQDYLEVIYLVGEVNIYPFTKSLSALLSRIMEKITSNQA